MLKFLIKLNFRSFIRSLLFICFITIIIVILLLKSILYRSVEIQKRINAENSFRRSSITRYDLNQTSNTFNIVIINLLRFQRIISKKIAE